MDGFACKHCDDVFIKKSSMYIHTYAMHSTNTVVTCESCCKVYSSNSNLYYHQRKEHDRPSSKRIVKKGTQGTHLCKTCGKTFSTRSNLLYHEQNHGRCKLDCMYCSKKLITEKFLKRHIARVHSQLLAGQKKNRLRTTRGLREALLHRKRRAASE
jgi:hypothetical protein